MTARMEIANLNTILNALADKSEQAEYAVQYALGMVALKVEAQAKTNASGRPGPNVRTGNLRNSIAAQKVQRGFGDSYVTNVSASMEYARAVEMGHPRWKPGVKYPYLGPAARDLSSNGTLDAIFTSYFLQRMRG